jgi:hypothetical protein
MKVVNLYKDTYDVYIGRAGKGKSGYFGNPIIVGKICPECGIIHGKGETLKCFEVYSRRRIENDLQYKERVKRLYGKVLGCFCDKLCHGQVLIKLTKELNEDL